MELSKQRKLMLLYLSEKNPLWRRIRLFETGRHVRKIDGKDIQEMAGVNHETIKNWRLGKEMRASRGEQVFSDTLKHLELCAEHVRARGHMDDVEHAELQDTVKACAKAFGGDDIDLYEIGMTLGLSVLTCQRVLDAVIYGSKPLLRSVYLPPAPKETRARDYAQIEAEKYIGVYLLWAQVDGVWMQCPMSIRYLQEVREGRFLRCKMNVPVMGQPGTEGTAYLQYDGFAVASEKTLFCTFERRQHGCVDLFYVVTDVPDNLGVEAITLGGTYLTSIAKGNVLIRRTSKEMSDPRHTYYRDLMTNAVKLLTSRIEVDDMDARWNQYAKKYGQDRDGAQRPGMQ